MSRIKRRYLKYLVNFLFFDNAFNFRKLRGVQTRFAFYRSMDLMFSILIIGILVIIAIPQYIDYRKRAIMISAVGYKTIMEQSHVYYSLTGLWPDDDDILNRYTQFQQLMYSDGNKYIESYQVDHGAAHFTYTDELDGKKLTFRPAIPNEDPLGAVIWIAGQTADRPDWSITGEDKTTVEPYMINRYLR